MIVAHGSMTDSFTNTEGGGVTKLSSQEANGYTSAIVRFIRGYNFRDNRGKNGMVCGVWRSERTSRKHSAIVALKKDYTMTRLSLT